MDLPSGRHEAPSRAGLILGLYSGLALLAVLVSAGRGDVDLYRIEGTSTPLRLLVSPALGVAAGLVVVALSRLAVHRFDWARRLHGDFRALLGALTAKEMAVLAAASAVGEELLFRGALQPWIGLWPQAALFALLHIGPGIRFLPWTATAFVIGVGFGYLAQAMGDLGGPIVAHFVVNYLNLVFINSREIPPPARGAQGSRIPKR